jgi:RimJ/RimL family protein N-acetyltransferase
MKPIQTNRFELRDFLASDILFTSQHPIWQAARPRINYQLGVFKRTDQTPVGSAGIMMEGCRSGDAALELLLTKENRGKYAYAYEIGFALIDWAFDTLSLNNLIIENTNRVVSVDRLAAKAGFTRVKNDRSPDTPRWLLSFGQWEDTAAKLRTT